MEVYKEIMGKYCVYIFVDYLNVIFGYNYGGFGLRRLVIVKFFYLVFCLWIKYVCEDVWIKNGVCRGGGGCSF